MLNILAQVEDELPDLLNLEDWNSTHVTYQPPEVHRLWRQWGDYRIFLHKILPSTSGKESLYHPHPWPSVVKVVDCYGQYKMGVGYGPGLQEPPLAATIWARPGVVYEMMDPNGWHFVEMSAHSYSIMITGKPWGREMPHSDHPKQGPLSPEMVEALKEKFANYYPQPVQIWTPALCRKVGENRPDPTKAVYYTAFDPHDRNERNLLDQITAPAKYVPAPQAVYDTELITECLAKGLHFRIRLGSPSSRVRYDLFGIAPRDGTWVPEGWP